MTWIPEVEGYKLFLHNRSVTNIRAPKNYGGVGFVIKNNIIDEFTVNIVDKSCDGILAIELIDKISGYSIMLVSCYLPPENSI